MREQKARPYFNQGLEGGREREVGAPRRHRTCRLAPISCCLSQEYKEPAWEEGSGCIPKKLCVLGQVTAPSGP